MIALAVLLSIVAGGSYYSLAASYVSTDDAFVDGHVVQVSPQITGRVSRIHIADNQSVQQGDLLVEIDPSDCQATLAQAQAALDAALAKLEAASAAVETTVTTSSAAVEEASATVDTATASVDSTRGQVAEAASECERTHAAVSVAEAAAEQSRAEVEAAGAEARMASADADRFRALYEQGVVSRQQYERAATASETAAARLVAAQKAEVAAAAKVAEARAAEQTALHVSGRARSEVAVSEARVGEARGRLAAAKAAPQQVSGARSQQDIERANVERARAAVVEAQLALSHTKIYAPTNGRVTKRSVEEGAMAQVGQVMLAIVSDDLWVTANFKETQLDGVRPGQPVELVVDAYPGRVFRGRVDSIQSGSGARFSLLPPENATGNYVKVVQRVPVKIVFDGALDPACVLGPGMSVTPKVRVR